MKRTGILLVVGLLFGMALAVGAAPGRQAGPQTPPTIITFAVDMPSITLADAEAGQLSAVLSWHVVGMDETHYLDLHTYQINAWQPMLLRSAAPPLEPTGLWPIIVQHPLNFGPPTYRLSIVDAAGAVVDQRVVMIPYAPDPADPPVIEDFTAVPSVNAADLAAGSSRVPVRWRVANRRPTTNLVFEQVLADGSAVSVELPRPNLWVPSSGEGPLAPVLPGSERTLELRLRLVDLVDGSVLAEQTLSLPVVGATPTPPPTVPPPPTRTPVVSGGGQPVVPPPVIDSLTVSPNPVDRGGTVTVSWVVQNAASVTVYRANPAGQFADFLTDQPLVGSWTLPLPDYHVDSAVFYVWAEGPDGTQVSASVTVQVNCPYTYFFGEPDPSQGCPLRAAISVQAALQPFQNGYMIWRGDVAQIYVLSKSGSVNRFQDTWAGEAITFPEAPPSPDLIQPARGFGKVWTENAWVRDQLGWATGPEQGYTMQVQSSGAYRYPYLYMTWPDGRVFYVVETQWSFLN